MITFPRGVDFAAPSYFDIPVDQITTITLKDSTADLSLEIMFATRNERQHMLFALPAYAVAHRET